MKVSKVGAVETAAPTNAEASVRSEIARRAIAFCDQALDLLYREQQEHRDLLYREQQEHRDGSFAGLEDVVTAIEAARTELIRLETSVESQS
jgi:hypothetical protein